MRIVSDLQINKNKKHPLDVFQLAYREDEEREWDEMSELVQ